MMTKLIPLTSKRMYGSLIVYHLSFIMLWFFFYFGFCFATKVLHTLICLT